MDFSITLDSRRLSEKIVTILMENLDATFHLTINVKS